MSQPPPARCTAIALPMRRAEPVMRAALVPIPILFPVPLRVGIDPSRICQVGPTFAPVPPETASPGGFAHDPWHPLTRPAPDWRDPMNRYMIIAATALVAAISM